MSQKEVGSSRMKGLQSEADVMTACKTTWRSLKHSNGEQSISHISRCTHARSHKKAGCSFSCGHASPCQTLRQPLATARPPTKTEGACTRKKVRAGRALPTASRALAGSFANPAGLRSRVKLHPEPRLLQPRNQPNFPLQTRSAYPHLGHARAASFRPTPAAMAERCLRGNRGRRTCQGSQTSHSPQTGPTSMGNIPERSSNDCCRQVLVSCRNATTSPALVFS